MTRPVRIDRARALAACVFDAPTERESALLDAVLDRFDSDRRSFSDVFEWSLSGSESGVDSARFSYAFPTWTREREALAELVVAWAERMGESVAVAARQLVRAAQHRAVQQVLVGFARGRGEPARAKLYLQFTDGAGPTALAMARKIVGLNVPTSSDALPLHLLGLDVGERGLSGAKLYFASKDATRTGRRLEDALLIHRIAGPDDETARTPVEIDFALRGISPSLAELAVVDPACGAVVQRLDALGASFRLRPRRLSLSLSGAPKANVYYVLDEIEDA